VCVPEYRVSGASVMGIARPPKLLVSLICRVQLELTACRQVVGYATGGNRHLIALQTNNRNASRLRQWPVSCMPFARGGTTDFGLQGRFGG